MEENTKSFIAELFIEEGDEKALAELYIEKGEKNMKNIYRISQTAYNIKETFLYKMIKLAENGKIRDFKRMYKNEEFLNKYSFLRNGYIKFGGYLFNFRPFLKKYKVRLNGDKEFFEIYGISKQDILKKMRLYAYDFKDFEEIK